MAARSNETVPTTADCTIHAAGVRWDAIRVPPDLGDAALRILGPRSGGVISDARFLYWFVPIGTAGSWVVPATRALGRGQHLVIPPPGRTAGAGRVHWKICPGKDALVTPADALRAALEDAARLTPRSPESR